MVFSKALFTVFDGMFLQVVSFFVPMFSLVGKPRYQTATLPAKWGFQISKLEFEISGFSQIVPKMMGNSKEHPQKNVVQNS